MHLLYVGDSVDEAIYEKEDWGDLRRGGEEHLLGLAPWGQGARALARSTKDTSAH